MNERKAFHLMPTISIKRLIASAVLVAAGCATAVLTASLSNGNKNTLKLISLYALSLSMFLLIGAGAGNLWKRPSDGAAIGLCCYLALMLLAILGFF
jgi:uncharacterized protein YfiM (DUF2279 family)